MAERPGWNSPSRVDTGKQENGTTSIGVVVINERTRGNLLSVPSRGVNLMKSFGSDMFSREGFAENLQGQRQLADFYINTLHLTARGPLLDAGFGTNIHISNRFSKRGIPSYALDVLTVDNQAKLWHSPKIKSRNDAGVVLVSGDIAGLGSSDSDLRGHQFGTILFNGSWDSGGNNFVVGGEMAEAKHHALGSQIPHYDFLDREKTAILKACRDQLTDTGVIGVVSSRYAFYGGGYEFDQLPEEKLSFIDLYTRFRKLGAKKMYIVGLSQDGFDELLEVAQSQLSEYIAANGPSKFMYPVTPEEQATGRDQLRSPSDIDIEESCRYFPAEWNTEGQIQRLADSVTVAQQVPAFSQVARIDAMFAEF